MLCPMEALYIDQITEVIRAKHNLKDGQLDDFRVWDLSLIHILTLYDISQMPYVPLSMRASACSISYRPSCSLESLSLIHI